MRNDDKNTEASRMTIIIIPALLPSKQQSTDKAAGFTMFFKQVLVWSLYSNSISSQQVIIVASFWKFSACEFSARHDKTLNRWS